jgi:hypothetical protein
LPISEVGAVGRSDAVVRVRLTSADGAPIGNATVLATVLWTSRDDYERHGGARARTFRTNADGTAALPIKLDGRQRASAGRNGDWATVSVVALDATGRPIAGATMSRYVGSRTDQRARARSMPLAGLVELRSTARGASKTAWAPPAEAALQSCTYYWDEDGYATKYAQVGELHVDSDVDYARFTYGRTADTTFDVVGQTGIGDWRATSSVHVGNTLDTAVWANAGGKTNYHWALRTQFLFVRLKLFKDCVGGPYRAAVGPQEVQPLEWTGNGMTLANTLAQPARKAANTSTFGPNTGWFRSSGALTKWAASVSAFGAAIGAQSGASSNVKIEYDFGGRPTHYLYGDTGLPSVAKRVFQATP